MILFHFIPSLPELAHQQQKSSFPTTLLYGSHHNSSASFDHHPLQLPAQMAMNMRRLLEQERLVRAIPAVRQPSIIERTADRSVWFPAVVTSLFAGSQKRSATICRRQSERLLLYPTLQFAKTSLRTELRVARTIAGSFTFTSPLPGIGFRFISRLASQSLPCPIPFIVFCKFHMMM
jgi:hypothetical protein